MIPRNVNFQGHSDVPFQCLQTPPQCPALLRRSETHHRSLEKRISDHLRSDITPRKYRHNRSCRPWEDHIDCGITSRCAGLMFRQLQSSFQRRAGRISWIMAKLTRLLKREPEELRFLLLMSSIELRNAIMRTSTAPVTQITLKT